MTSSGCCVTMECYATHLKLCFDILVTVNIFKNSLTLDSYNILQGTYYFYYKNTRIIKNIVNNGNVIHNMFKYIGVTHEYISTPSDNRIDNLSKDIIFIKDSNILSYQKFQ